MEGRSGKLAAFTVGVSQGRLVQVTEYSDTNVEAAADSLTFRNTSQIEHKTKPHQNPALGTWVTEPGLEMTTQRQSSNKK